MKIFIENSQVWLSDQTCPEQIVAEVDMPDSATRVIGVFQQMQSLLEDDPSVALEILLSSVFKLGVELGKNFSSPSGEKEET